MANSELVMPYTPEWADLVLSEGGVPPPVNAGNRWPTREEVVAAIEAEGLLAVREHDAIIVRPPADAPEVVDQLLRRVVQVQWDQAGVVYPVGEYSYLVAFECQDWERLGLENIGLFIRGQNWPLEVFLGHRLAQTCGQLVLYNTGGGVPLVISPDSDPGRLASLWLEADPSPDGCRWLYEQLPLGPGRGG